MRWDLLERFDILKKGDRAVARKSYTGEEDFFGDHYPGSPTVPETLFLEMIAQTGGVLYGLGLDFRKELILAKISEAKFPIPVRPPCVLEIEARIEEEREEGAWISGAVRHGERTVATARLLLVTMDSLGDGGNKKIVFNDGFLEHFDVYSVAKKSEALP